jgi:hypothetical protein
MVSRLMRLSLFTGMLRYESQRLEDDICNEAEQHASVTAKRVRRLVSAKGSPRTSSPAETLGGDQQGPSRPDEVEVTNPSHKLSGGRA